MSWQHLGWILSSAVAIKAGNTEGWQRSAVRIVSDKEDKRSEKMWRKPIGLVTLTDVDLFKQQALKSVLSVLAQPSPSLLRYAPKCKWACYKTWFALTEDRTGTFFTKQRIKKEFRKVKASIDDVKYPRCHASLYWSSTLDFRNTLHVFIITKDRNDECDTVLCWGTPWLWLFYWPVTNPCFTVFGMCKHQTTKTSGEKYYPSHIWPSWLQTTSACEELDLNIK